MSLPGTAWRRMMARLALGTMWLMRLLPLPLLAALGNAFGMALYMFAVERRRVCITNLRRCFPGMGDADREAMCRSHFRVVGRSVLERGILWWSARERIEQLVEVRGLEHLAEARAAGPVILLVPHFVGLDAGYSRLTCLFDLTSLYAMQKSAVMNRALLAGRTRFGDQRLFSRQDGIRPALKAMKQARPLYYLPDMDYGPRDAVFVDFFGVPAATITGLSRIARAAGALVVPCVTAMRPGGRGYEIRFYPAWDDFPGHDVTADTRRMNAFIEERVREMPAQYFWTHKRFKTRPPGEAKWY